MKSKIFPHLSPKRKFIQTEIARQNDWRRHSKKTTWQQLKEIFPLESVALGQEFHSLWRIFWTNIFTLLTWILFSWALTLLCLANRLFVTMADLVETGKAKAAGFVSVLLGLIAFADIVSGLVYASMGGIDGSGLWTGFGVCGSLKWTVYFRADNDSVRK